MARTWTLELPYASPPLRDNDRMHWAKKANITKMLRQAAFVLAVNALPPLPIRADRVSVTLHWQPATNRRRDQLSIAPTLKPLVDGLVDARLISDDDTEHCELSCRIEPVAKPARLWLTITDLSEVSA